jgi:thiol-disulfide isomerase/thioredoxin
MKLVQCVLFLIAPLFVLSQTKELNLPLIFHDGNGSFEYINWPVKWEDTSIAFKNTYPEIKGIPENLKNIKRGIVCFDFAQYIYQNFIGGKMSEENFDKIKNMMGESFNEKVLVKNKIKCYVNIIRGTNGSNENVCLIDSNNNYDFSDDVSFMPLDNNTPDETLNKHLIKVVCQRILNGKIINDTVSVLIVKQGTLFLFSIAQYATVTLNIEKKNYQLAVCPLYFHSRRWEDTQMILMTDSLKTKKAAPDLIINNDGFIKIGKSIYKFNRVDITRNTLSLQKMSGNNQYSSQVGFQAPLFKSENLLTGKDISLASYKGKYILIDFWGTWCQPCRKQLPELIKLNNLADSSQFVLISIASSDSLDNLKEVIAKENMLWPQIFSDKITEQYRISAFPTSLLIDPNGIVIAKDLSMDDLKEKLSKLGLLKED